MKTLIQVMLGVSIVTFFGVLAGEWGTGNRFFTFLWLVNILVLSASLYVNKAGERRR